MSRFGLDGSSPGEIRDQVFWVGAKARKSSVVSSMCFLLRLGVLPVCLCHQQSSSTYKYVDVRIRVRIMVEKSKMILVRSEKLNEQKRYNSCR